MEKSTGNDEVILVTKDGNSIRFEEEEIRPMERNASGVKGIKLRKGDELIGMEVIKSKKSCCELEILYCR